MPLKHPKGPAASATSLSVPPLFTRESADVPHKYGLVHTHDSSTAAGFHH